MAYPYFSDQNGVEMRAGMIVLYNDNTYEVRNAVVHPSGYIEAWDQDNKLRLLPAIGCAVVSRHNRDGDPAPVLMIIGIVVVVVILIIRMNA